jgi:hypothetical protein
MTQTAAAGELYIIETQSDLDCILLWEGDRPFQKGDVVYCYGEIGRSGAFRYSLVRVSHDGLIRVIPGTEFGADPLGRPLGWPADVDARKAFEEGNPAAVDIRKQVAHAMNALDEEARASRLAHVEPGAVLMFKEADGSQRLAMVLGNTRGANPVLTLSARGDDGKLVRRKVTACALAHATILSDPGMDTIERGLLHVAGHYPRGTILRFKPLTLRGPLGTEWSTSCYGMVDKVTGLRTSAETMVHLKVQGQFGPLEKVAYPLRLFQEVAVIG